MKHLYFRYTKFTTWTSYRVIGRLCYFMVTYNEDDLYGSGTDPITKKPFYKKIFEERIGNIYHNLDKEKGLYCDPNKVNTASSLDDKVNEVGFFWYWRNGFDKLILNSDFFKEEMLDLYPMHISHLEIERATRVQINKGRSFPISNFIRRNLPLMWITDPLSDSNQWKAAWSIDLYDNALVISLEDSNPPRFLIYENDNLGFITDKDLNIVGFISWNLTQEESDMLYKHAEVANKHYVRESSEVEVPAIKLEKGYAMEYRAELMQQLFKLNKSNLWLVLYYGYEKQFIDEAFCSDIAREYQVSQESNRLRIMHLAHINKDEYYLIPELLKEISESDIGDIAERDWLYNKIWMHAVMASQLQADKFI